MFAFAKNDIATLSYSGKGVNLCSKDINDVFYFDSLMEGPALYENGFVWYIGVLGVQLAKCINQFEKNKLRILQYNSLTKKEQIQWVALDGYHVLFLSSFGSVYLFEKWTLHKRFYFRCAEELGTVSAVAMVKRIIIIAILHLLFYTWNGYLIFKTSLYQNIRAITPLNDNKLYLRRALKYHIANLKIVDLL